MPSAGKQHAAPPAMVASPGKRQPQQIPRALSHPDSMVAQAMFSWHKRATQQRPPRRAEEAAPVAEEPVVVHTPSTSTALFTRMSSRSSMGPVDLAWSASELTRSAVDSPSSILKEAVTKLLQVNSSPTALGSWKLAADDVANLCFRSCEDREVNQTVAVSSGIERPLVHMLQCFEVDVPAAISAARALANMCDKCPLAAMVIAQSGALEAAHQIVRNRNSNTKYCKAREECWLLLHNVADANVITHERLWDVGIVGDAMTFLASAAKDRKLRELITPFLCALSYSDANRSRLMPIVPLLLSELSKDGRHGASSLAPHTVAMEVHATIALANLIGPTEAEADMSASVASGSDGGGADRSELLVGTDKMQRLVDLLKCSSGGHKERRSNLHLEVWKVAAALAHLALPDPNKRRLRKVGAPLALVVALEDSLLRGDALGQEKCCEALWNLAFDADNAKLMKTLQAPNAVAVLRRCAEDGTGDSARDKALGALFILEALERTGLPRAAVGGEADDGKVRETEVEPPADVGMKRRPAAVRPRSQSQGGYPGTDQGMKLDFRSDPGWRLPRSRTESQIADARHPGEEASRSLGTKIRTHTPRKRAPWLGGEKGGYVMISYAARRSQTGIGEMLTSACRAHRYCHQQKACVHSIKETLVSVGYNVWIDEKDMSGSCLEAMARAVENATCLLLCCSRGYKESQVRAPVPGAERVPRHESTALPPASRRVARRPSTRTSARRM